MMSSYEIELVLKTTNFYLESVIKKCPQRQRRLRGIMNNVESEPRDFGVVFSHVD